MDRVTSCSYSTLLLYQCRLLHDTCTNPFYDKMAKTDDKIDALLHSVDALKQSQKENQEWMASKLSQLESEVTAGQDRAAQRACKKMGLE